MSVDGGARLSADAERVLLALRDCRADCPQRAVTDRRIAELTRIAERKVIDLRLELLEAGWLVISSSTGSKGAYIASDAAAISDAQAYIRTLRSRALGNFRRARAVRKCLERHRGGCGAHRIGEQLAFGFVG